MKKLYRKSTVHPSPQPPPLADPLAFLPAAIFALAAALTPQDREVLAYLLSCSSVSTDAHTPAFNCDCFTCYTSYWARWDSSPNRQLIHEIIDAYEEWLPAKNSPKNKGGRRERRKKQVDDGDSPVFDRISDAQAEEDPYRGGEAQQDEEEEDEEMAEKGSVKKLVSFIGDRIWGFWG